MSNNYSSQQPFDLRDGLNSIGPDFRRGSSHGGRGRDPPRDEERHGRYPPRDGDRHGRYPPRDGDRHGRDCYRQNPYHQGHHSSGHPQVVPPPLVLNQILSLIHFGLLKGPVVLKTVIATLRESNPDLYREITGFLEVNGRSLFDAFRKVELVQNQDGSWSAISGLPDFDVFFNGVADAFRRSVFQFLDAKKHQHKDRPAFITASGQVITACGVLFVNSKNQILMQAVPDKKKQLSLDDFGGKVDHKDPHILDTLTRECREETNGRFPPDFNFLENMLEHLYIPSSKYLLLVCHSPFEFESMDLSLFGTSETHSSIQRTVHWVSVVEFLDAKNLHPRLFKSSEVKDTVCKLFQ